MNSLVNCISDIEQPSHYMKSLVNCTYDGTYRSRDRVEANICCQLLVCNMGVCEKTTRDISGIGKKNLTA